MAKIAIIGSNGQLGSDIKNLLAKDHSIIPLEHDKFFVENREVVSETLLELKPDIVINTAAFHNVASCEEQPQQSFLINATAIKYLSEACNAIDAALVHFSTDYVFGLDETRTKPYTENDLPGAIQVYGASKLAGEQILQSYCKKFYCIRVSGLYGLRGTRAKKYANFVEMMIALGLDAVKRQEKLPSAGDQTLIFNPTIEIANSVKFLLNKKDYGLYHVVCSGFSTRANFVRAIFEIMNIPAQVVDVDSAYFKPAYRQPRFSALDNGKILSLGMKLPNWRDALEKYLHDREKHLMRGFPDFLSSRYPAFP
nr:NAD(P)-dependent oxidoreductase [Candidatus Sigynarchaeota archaeon]